MTCRICGRRLIGTDVIGRYWVWIHAEGSPTELGHYAQPVKAARR
jgi:hypothetical protein